jgi:hypothetical protein
MDVGGVFHRKKIAKRRPPFRTKKIIGVGRGGYDEKDTRCNENLKVIAAHRAQLPKRHVFRRKFKQRDR